MTPEGWIARWHAMDGSTWARHANPWSVWTRVPILPLLVLAIWSRAWIGGWFLLPVAALLAWTWINPRVFAPPRRLDSWGSRAVLGERLWLARRTHPVPPRHRRMPALLNWLAALGAVVLLYGLMALDAVATLSGLAVALLAKMWFLDRMVWLVADMEGDPRLGAWRGAATAS